MQTITRREVRPAHVSAGVAEYVKRLAQATGDNTMPIQQVLTLVALHQTSEVNQVDLEQYTGVTASSNQRNLYKLGGGWLNKPGLGLVEGYRDPKDNRYMKVRLTPKGRAIMDQVAADTAHVMERYK